MKIGDRVEMITRLDLVYEVGDKGTIEKKPCFPDSQFSDWIVRLDKFKNSKLFPLWNLKEEYMRVIDDGVVHVHNEEGLGLIKGPQYHIQPDDKCYGRTFYVKEKI